MIAALMGVDRNLLSNEVKVLESASDYPSVDVRLQSEIISKVFIKKRELGLDPNDTTGRELYRTLYNLTILHDSFLARRIGAKDPAKVAEVLPLIKKAVDELDIPKEAWVLKHSVAKRLLKATPPKVLMKRLGYRSVDSMLKREKVPELFGALRFAESEAWMTSFLARYQKLQPSDFEVRNIEIICLDKKRWLAIAEEMTQKNRHNITHLKEMGVIMILPLPVDRLDGLTITLLPMVLMYINEIRLYSSYFKHQQVRADFGEILTETLDKDPAHHAVMAGVKLHWRIITRRYGRLELKYHPEVFEPHVTSEDLRWHHPEAVLYRLEPALHFWHGMEYVGTETADGIVSFNILDMAINVVNKLPYRHHVTYHMQEALKHELHERYLGQPGLEAQVLRQLGGETVDPELVLLSGGKRA